MNLFTLIVSDKDRGSSRNVIYFVGRNNVMILTLENKTEFNTIWS